MAMSAVDFANKINWEGGLIGALEYGLCSTDLADDETELIEAWRALEEWWSQSASLFDQVEQIIDIG